MGQTDIYNEGWFVGGHLEILTGAGSGLTGSIKLDEGAGQRRLMLWAPIEAKIDAGDRIRLTAGCDKRAKTCRKKFSNFINFQGFPDIPGDDWLVSVPRSGRLHNGGSLIR